jgi:hypothetical protein
MSDIKSKVENQKVRVAMNVKHLTVQSGDTQLVQLENGQYRELPVKDISFHREGDENESPYTRFYDLTKPDDKEAIDRLKVVMAENPSLVNDMRFRVKIVGEYEIAGGLPWPGYDDQNAQQVVTYYDAMPPSVRPDLEKIMQYEMSREDPSDDKIDAIERLAKREEATAKARATTGAKL